VVPDRRVFLRTGLGAAAALAAGRRSRSAPAADRRAPRVSSLAEAVRAREPRTIDALRTARHSAARLRPVAGGPPPSRRFRDLKQRFVFEYYPWYGASPWLHWDQWSRQPPHDIAANYLPRLGAYDSADRAVVEQHARWIVESGVGAINLSWWGRDTREDQLVPLVLDVMRDHGLKVAFHLEPYADDHGYRFADDVLYLLRRYGEQRRWDALLLLENPGGRGGVSPVFKGFRTILPADYVDCLGVQRTMSDYTPDDVYARQFEQIRGRVRGDFEHLLLLSDSLDYIRAARSGFDGIAIYDNFIPPSAYDALAGRATEAGLLFSFNINPGFDQITPRDADLGECYAQPPVVPQGDGLDWSIESERERAARLSAARITESAEAALAVQSDPAFVNAATGFYLVYLTSFNEWHEGHMFEPMMDAAAIGAEERRFGYRNPAAGDYRLRVVSDALAPVLPVRKAASFIS